MELLSYLYTKPIVKYNTENQNGTSNYDLWYQHVSCLKIEEVQPEKQRMQELIASKLILAEATMQWGKMADTLTFQRLHFPQKVGVLMNSKTEGGHQSFYSTGKTKVKK